MLTLRPSQVHAGSNLDMADLCNKVKGAMLEVLIALKVRALLKTQSPLD